MSTTAYVVQPLTNTAARRRGGIGALPGDPLVPCGAPVVLQAASHDHAAAAAAEALRAPYPWSARGLLPGDALAVSGKTGTRLYAVGQHGVVEFLPETQTGGRP
jgi:hypothetical protein